MANILIIDDHAINREFLNILLSYVGHTVTEAGDGAEGLDKARALQPQLVISDIFMPVMDGIEFARQLHADPSVAHIPVIFYTATYRLPEARAMGNTCGVMTVLAKPSEPQLIIDTVAKQLGQTAKPLQTLPSLPETKNKSSDQLAEKLSSYLSDLNALQQQLQLNVERSLTLLAEGSIQRITIDVTDSLQLVQKLGLRLSVLIDMGLTLSSERDPEKLVELFCRAAQDVMSSRYVAIWLVDANGKIKSQASCGFANAAQAKQKMLSGILAEVQATAMPQRMHVTKGDIPKLGLPASHRPIHGFMALPVKSITKSYGVLYLADKLGDTSYDLDDERIAITMTSQFTLALENLALYDESRQYAGQLELEGIKRRQMIEQLQESEARFRQLAENIHEVFFLLNADYSQILYVSPGYEKIWGRSCESLYAAPRSWTEAIHPDDMQRMQAGNTKRDKAGWSKFDFECRIVRPDNSFCWIHARGFPVLNEDGIAFRIAGLAEDITERTKNDERIRRLNRIYSVLSGINSAIVRIHDRNDLFQETCRIAVDDGAFALAWVGKIDPVTLDGEVVAWRGDKADSVKNIKLSARAGHLESQRPACVAMREKRPVICNDIGTQLMPVSLRKELLAQGYQSTAAFPLLVESRVVGVFVLFAWEISFFDEDELRLLNELAGDLSFGLQFIEKEEEISYLAYYDVLTGLPNTTLFHDRLKQLLSAAGRKQDIVAVIMLDLENFSQLNDVLGRRAGDTLLQQLAVRMQSVLRDPYTLARTSGNTFAVAVGNLREVADTVIIIEQRIFGCFTQTFMLDQQEVRVSAHAGLALYPADGNDADTLFKYAEIALKKAKTANERYLFFAAQMNAAIATRVAMENDMRRAIEEKQFVIHYQPRVDLRTGRMVGAEALIRWQHPQHGMVPPLQFIPLAEETGLIVPIGAWVIDAVCEQQAAWLAQRIKVVPVAINLSAVQFRKGDVLETIADTFEHHRLAPKHIEFELTESIVMSNPEEATYSLQKLKKLGVKLSLDDFGTGYSSLAYLKRFPFDFVKIDRAFVTDITTSKADAALANAIIAMARGLSLHVIAEGVETEEQLNYLRKLGCDEMQGYYFSKPVPAEAFAEMLRECKTLTFSGQL